MVISKMERQALKEWISRKTEGGYIGRQRLKMNVSLCEGKQFTYEIKERITREYMYCKVKWAEQW